ncbi:MAG: 3-deoxy-D-manno-octulosonic acid transferase [Alphaproteobacteria bacterium]|nr:3-deoxy-D-manno-octulosonic acid transferase [Alphaproteobacteria bacterium]
MPSLYRLLTNAAAPFIALYLHVRKARGKEDEQRFHERLGFASIPRPHGKMVWCHAASVGEVLSVLSLLEQIRKGHPTWSILLTTGTVTSATLVKDRLPDGVVHQYIPVDRWPYVSRFLHHWKPNLVLWVESELWPNMLASLEERHIPAILLNGRMSDKSYQRWRLIPSGVRRMLAVFVLGLTQTGAERNRYAALGLTNVRAIGNLKFAANPLPCDRECLATMKESIADRPVWLMASTHPGEDEIAIKIHRQLRKSTPHLLTILVPRHPVRGDTIAELLEREKISFARRSLHDPLTQETEIYLADTMGEMGLFYRLCRLCCLAGSFTWGGHNPVEPALLNCAVVFGPKMDNFAIMSDDMLGQGAAIQVSDATELAQTLARLIHSPNETEALAHKALQWAQDKHKVLTDTLGLIDPYFDDKGKA